MLIPLSKCVLRYGVRPGPVLHVGAHRAEEADAYRDLRFRPVWWVEGNPALTRRLAANTQRYPGNYAVEALCLEQEQDAVLHVANNGQSSSVLELGTHAVEHPEVRYVYDVKVRATTVDGLHEAGRIGQATLMNIDVQGAELRVLKGAERYLEGVEVVYSEVNERELYRECALLPVMDDWLAERGFKRVATAMAGSHGWGDALYVR